MLHNKSLRCLGVGVLICCPSILRAANDPRININLVGPSEGLIRKRTPLHIAATHGNAGAARTILRSHADAGGAILSPLGNTHTTSWLSARQVKNNSKNNSNIIDLPTQIKQIEKGRRPGQDLNLPYSFDFDFDFFVFSLLCGHRTRELFVDLCEGVGIAGGTTHSVSPLVASVCYKAAQVHPCFAPSGNEKSERPTCNKKE